MRTPELLKPFLHPLVVATLLWPVSLACSSDGPGNASGGSSSSDGVDDDDDDDDDDANTNTDSLPDSSPGMATTGADDTGSAASTEGPGNSPGAPKLLSFSVNSTSINELDSLVFSAVITDPDGIDDVIGGTLHSPEGGSYGAFQTASSEGAYELTLSWQDLRTVEDIDVEGGRTFVAEFFDQVGNSVTDSIQVELTCSGENELCEPGSCDPVDVAEHCGSCTNDCEELDVPALLTVPQVDRYPGSPWTDTGESLWCDPQTNCNISLIVDGFSGISCSNACSPWEATAAVTYFGRDPVGVDSFPDPNPNLCLCEQP